MNNVTLRKFPYPFRNMLSLLSDTDLTSKAEFEGMHKFMNTLEACGNLGFGVGLDIGDTFFMGTIGAPDDHSSPNESDQKYWKYWWNDTLREVYAEDIRKYIKAGWIDIPHTFFSLEDKARFTRAQVKDVLREWKSIRFTPNCWVDHANNPWNMLHSRKGHLIRSASKGELRIDVSSNGKQIKKGHYLMFQQTGEKAFVEAADQLGKALRVSLSAKLQHSYPENQLYTIHSPLYPEEGAVPGSAYYCIDLALRAGIKVFWTRMPADMEKKTSKGRWGFNSTLIPETLPNGQSVWGMIRYYETGQTNNTYLGACINRVLYGDLFSAGKAMLPDTYMILSTHLGYVDMDGVMDQLYKTGDDVYTFNGNRWFNPATITALRNLKEEQEKGRVLVTRTSRLINYNLAHDLLSKYSHTNAGYKVDISDGYERIVIYELHDDLFGSYTPKLTDLRGITFYCHNPNTAQIWIGQTRINPSELQINKRDHSGKKSLGIKWFPPDTKDYTVKL